MSYTTRQSWAEAFAAGQVRAGVDRLREQRPGLPLSALLLAMIECWELCPADDQDVYLAEAAGVAEGGAL